MTPPTWLDAAGHPRPTQACWTCGREVAPMRFRAEDLRPHGWAPPQTLQIPDWCGCSTEYLPVPVGLCRGGVSVPPDHRITERTTAAHEPAYRRWIAYANSVVEE